jgi:hypothetical protein
MKPRCCWCNCCDFAVCVFTDPQGDERGLCQFHRPQAERAAASLGVGNLVTRPPETTTEKRDERDQAG